MKNYVIDLLIRKLEDYKGEKIEGYEFAYKLLEQYNVDGCTTYNTYDSKEWIKKHFDEIGEVLENYKYNYGDEALSSLTLDIFNNPEKAMVIIVFEVAYNLIGQIDFINNNWDSFILLNDNHIKLIKSELEKEYLKCY